MNKALIALFLVFSISACGDGTLGGEQLYEYYCSGCHGPLGSSEKQDRTAAEIQAAIDADVGGMGGLSILHPITVEAIADALVSVSPPPPPPPSDGDILYANNCSGCHGPLESSTKTGRTAAQIQAAIDANTGGMGGLSFLTATNIQAIADALAGGPPPPPPTDGAILYANKCSGCHGPLATSAKTGRTAAQIQAAIDANTGGMGGLSSLTSVQVQAIADALNN
ncbi:MAG: cytochrome c [Nitrospirota bacterium]|nr:MAG: cytochrome c [Nitrospirota bacterium]